jgi:hypothetical protein
MITTIIYKFAYLIDKSGLDALLPHTLFNAEYPADHWYHLIKATSSSPPTGMRI